MVKSLDATPVPQGYARLDGSERHRSPTARYLGPADAQERFTVTIVLRRRADMTALPQFDHFLTTPLSARPRLSRDEFAQKHGASAEDLSAVTQFASKNGLEIVRTDAASRAVVVAGTVEQISKAFAVKLEKFEREVPGRRGKAPRMETYRGREGYVHVPAELAPIVLGVFGLDNRDITKRNAADPPNTATLSVQEITALYNFPDNSAAGQTIGIFSEGGYRPADISSSFGGSPPKVTDISVDASNNGSPDGETTQDIVIAAAAAPGASIAVYFTSGSQQGWVDLIHRVVHPQAGDPVCSVVSSSFYICDGDDPGTLSSEGVTAALLNAVTQAFQDAAIQGVTICVACGDTGTNSKVGDGKAHVQYPGSDPWVLSVGGTTIGNVNGSNFDEYVWNDPNPSDPSHWGTTGGGVSDYFALPSYQAGAGVPASINDGKHVGRGVPDVSGNASYNSGYKGIIVGGDAFTGNGTSASSPLWAGLIAVINAALGVNVGFVNPALYEIGSAGFNDLTGAVGPADNNNGGVKGYPAGIDWDACTGWGSPNGTALLNWLRSVYVLRNPRVLADLSVNGRSDIVGFGNAGVWTALSSGDGAFGAPAFVVANFGYDGGGWRVEKHPRFLADLTGNGRADIVGFGDAGVWTALSNGDGTFGAPAFVVANFGYDGGGWRVEKHPRFLADLTGKGRADIVGFGYAGVWTALSNGDGTFGAPAFVVANFGYDAGGWRVEKHPRFLADLTGNGRADIVGFGDAGVWTALSNGDGGFQPPAFVVANFGYDGGGWRVEKHPRFLADLTGNGRADIVGFGDAGVWTALSNGDGTFQPPKFVVANFGYDGGGWRVEKHPRFLADLTGNGRADIVGFGDAGVWTALSNGDGTFQPPQFVVANFGYNAGGWRVDKHPRFLADLRGNGRADIVGFGDAGVWTALSNGDGTFQPPQFVVANFGYDAGGWR
jgi:Pro-kumamolisin, activation domain/FG-GAP-like repeat